VAHPASVKWHSASGARPVRGLGRRLDLPDGATGSGFPAGAVLVANPRARVSSAGAATAATAP
jgi:hypothetical protein